MDRRVPGQSQLDYLWTTFGESYITAEVVDDPKAIPTIQLIKDLLGQGSIGSLSQEGMELVVKSPDGTEIDRFDFSQTYDDSKWIQAIENYTKEVQELQKSLGEFKKLLDGKQNRGNYVTSDKLQEYVSVTEYNALKENFEALKTWTENMFKSDEDTVSDIEKGGDITLVKDVHASSQITITENTDLDLGGRELSAAGGRYGDTLSIGNGSEVTIKNGVLKQANTASVQNSSATVLVANAKVTLEDVVVDGVYPVYANNANAVVTINSGTYLPLETNNDKGQGVGVAIYAQNAKKITINGGTFGRKGYTTDFLLNLKDNLRYPTTQKQPNEILEVRGGIFINFDPSNNKAEGEGTNFLAEGYTVEVSESGQDTIYTVVPVA